MYYARSLFLISFLLSFPFYATGTVIPLVSTRNLGEKNPSIYDTICPDGLPGRVTQIQTETASRPGIHLTDCSPARNGTLTGFNPWDQTRLDKRQEQICPADCSNSCSSGAGPSSNDCTILANQLSDRNSQFTVGSQQTIHQESGTCMFSLVNMVASPFIYCDSAWALRSRGVMSSCSSGGMCQGSRFQAVVGINPSASSPTPTPAPAATTPASNPGTTNQGGNGNSSNNNGGNNGATTGGSGNTSAGNGANTDGSGNASNSNGGGSGLSGTGTSGANTSNGTPGSGVGQLTTTLSNGSVLIVPTGSVTLPSGAGGDSNGVNISTGEKNGSGGTNIPAIVGAVLGILILFALLILFLLWRRKKRAQRKLEALEQMSEAHPRDSSVARTVDLDSAVDGVPALGFGRGTGDSPQDEFASGAHHGRMMGGGTKARLIMEEAQPRRSEQTDLSSSIEPSNYTNNYTDVTPAPVYRTRSQISRDGRQRGTGRRYKPSRGSRDNHTIAYTHTRDGSGGTNRDAYASDGYSTITGSSGSMSARTFAQAAAPNLSPADIDRLAESIVARMQGRDPRDAIAEERSSVADDEPPPPWSPNRVSNLHGL